MFNIKKQVLELGNSMVASYKSFEQTQNQTKPNQNQKYSKDHGFGQFLAYSDMFGIKKHVLMLGNSMVASNISYEPIKNQTTPNQNQKYSKNMV